MPFAPSGRHLWLTPFQALSLSCRLPVIILSYLDTQPVHRTMPDNGFYSKLLPVLVMRRHNVLIPPNNLTGIFFILQEASDRKGLRQAPTHDPLPFCSKQSPLSWRRMCISYLCSDEVTTSLHHQIPQCSLQGKEQIASDFAGQQKQIKIVLDK